MGGVYSANWAAWVWVGRLTLGIPTQISRRNDRVPRACNGRTAPARHLPLGSTIASRLCIRRQLRFADGVHLHEHRGQIMRPASGGIDFGTSNSTVGFIEGGRPRLVPLEDGHVTMPSAVFYNFEDNRTYFGRRAIADYTDHADGRLLRALKSVLGTSLINEKTRIKAHSIASRTLSARSSLSERVAGRGGRRAGRQHRARAAGAFRRRRPAGRSPRLRTSWRRPRRGAVSSMSPSSSSRLPRHSTTSRACARRNWR